jgi:hypothetical protein
MLPFYPKKCSETAEGRGKIEAKKIDVPYDHTDTEEHKNIRNIPYGV